MNPTKPKQMDVSPNTAFNCILEKVYWEMRKMLDWFTENCLTLLKHGTDNFHALSHVCLLGNLLAHKSVCLFCCTASSPSDLILQAAPT